MRIRTQSQAPMRGNPEPVAILRSTTGVRVPLERVSARGRLEGLVLELTVEQRYTNTSATNLEAVFTFPLPLRAVLLGFDLELGARKLSAVAVARAAASERYERAMDAGDTAALIEHDGNGLYTVSLGNLLAGETATIRYRYGELLDAHDRHVRINVPTVIAPRYGDPRDAGLDGPSVPRVDAFAEYPFDVTLDLVGLTDDAAVRSPSHRISITRTETGLQAALNRKGFLDRDFVLELTAAALPDSMLVAPDGDGFVALASARLRLDAAERRPLALKVLLDCSGSMNGDSIAAAKRALAAILERLEPADCVSVGRFGSRFEQITEGLEPADEHTLAPLKLRVRELAADMGGTEMQKAIASTLAVPLPRDATSADLVLITDGEVYAVDSVVDLAARSSHRLFVIAIGAAPNEALARALSAKTGGACEFVAPGEEAEAAILRTFKRLRSSPRTIAGVKWPIPPEWTAPLPSAVFAGDTLHLFAGFRAHPQGAATVTVRDAAGTELELTAAEARTDTMGDLLPRLAAARRLTELPEQEASALAVRYQLATKHTSFVVVAERAAAEKAQTLPTTVAVSHMLAAGWAGQGVVLEGLGALEDAAAYGSSQPVVRSVESNVMLASRSVETRPRAQRSRNRDLFESFEAPADRSFPGVPSDVRAAALASLAGHFRRGLRMPASLAELSAATGIPRSLVLLLEALVQAGHPEDMVVAVFLALLTRDAPSDALDASLRSACEGSVFGDRRYRDLRRLIEGVLVGDSTA